MEFCAYCRKDITTEIPNDWNPLLCFKCAQKDHFNERKQRVKNDQRKLQV